MGIRLFPLPPFHADTRSLKNIGWPILLILILVLSPFISSLPDTRPTHDPHPLCTDSKNELTCELQEMKMKIARLESTLEESTGNLNAKASYLEEKEKQIEEMTHMIQLLENVLVNNKKLQVDSSSSKERINGLEEEVRNLWAASRKTNFDIHILESKTRDAEEKIEELTSRVEQVENIVTEQWIQIRQLEQALQITEMRTLKAHAAADSTRCIFLKFIKGFNADHLQKAFVLDPDLLSRDFVLSPYLSRASQQFKRYGSAARKYHHELQGSVKQFMDRNEFTAALANEEVVFFLASAIIIFPLMTAWILYSSSFS
ncbi:Glycosyl transferase, family 35 [Cinnamomum micranthum f. kanehirae]|uniref:Glycosyl transferase, family 35 n=1 Tax=Cinnamomum micranthum f. kanehirae TaxID=337451 RepID=A0A3S3NKR4_9MAGN|nr:Glycosyl transferase, family 35 [Cinnamomum micranthum f. kanehirae]